MQLCSPSTGAKRPLFQLALTAAALLFSAASVQATQAGLRSFSASTAGAEPVDVALFYPTQAQAQTIPMGPFAPVLAMDGPLPERVKGLILLSHGTGGSELSHHQLAAALAQAGYLVAALRHPHDNWMDRSLVRRGEYFEERPRQVSRVLDALLSDPVWKDRIPAQRIGALGHSAGGFTVLALAGAQADRQRAREHCRNEGDQDPVFCQLGAWPTMPAAPASAAASSSENPPAASSRDARIRSVVAMAPVGVVLTPASLATIQLPVRLLVPSQDTVLVPQFHGRWLSQQIPGLSYEETAEAGHFAYMSQPNRSFKADAGDPASNPQGFDREAFQRRLAQDVVGFFDKTLQP